MKIKPGSPFLASGTVLARVVLPKGVNIGLDVSRVLPDILVFDGEVPDSDPGAIPDPTPLPDPLPARAFGHIRPDEWLPASCEPDVSEEREGTVFAVSAKIVDVPLEVLPGRQKQFSDFVSKVYSCLLFYLVCVRLTCFSQVVFSSDGAVAGIQGTAAVSVQVHGLPYSGPEKDGEMELSGLPVKGSVRVGKKGLLSPEMAWKRLKHILQWYSRDDTEEA